MSSRSYYQQDSFNDGRSWRSEYSKAEPASSKMQNFEDRSTRYDSNRMGPPTNRPIVEMNQRRGDNMRSINDDSSMIRERDHDRMRAMSDESSLMRQRSNDRMRPVNDDSSMMRQRENDRMRRPIHDDFRSMQERGSDRINNMNDDDASMMHERRGPYTGRSRSNENYPMMQKDSNINNDPYSRNRPRKGASVMGPSENYENRNRFKESNIDDSKRPMQGERRPHQRNFSDTGAGNPSKIDLTASINAFSQIGIQQQNDIAAKILKAVLSSVPNLGPMGPVLQGLPGINPHYHAGPDGNPNNQGGPGGNPNFQGGPGGNPNFQGGPGGNPNLQGGPGRNPNLQGGPGGNLNFQGVPGGNPNFQGGPGGNAHFQGGPGVNPPFQGRPFRNPNFHVGPVGNPNFQGGPDVNLKLQTQNNNSHNRPSNGPDSMYSNYESKMNRTRQVSQTGKSPPWIKFEKNKPESRFLARFRGRLEEKTDPKDRVINTKRQLSGEREDSAPKRERNSNDVDYQSPNNERKLALGDATECVDVEVIDASKENKKAPDASKEIPFAALFCHICRKSDFTSEKNYLFHLSSIQHKKTATIFKEKNDITLAYLRNDAKLANIRYGGFENKAKPTFCTICSALVKESFKQHYKLLEHRIVSSFLSPKCCGRSFKSKHEVDEHRLSLPHLKNSFENTGNKIFTSTVDGSDNVKSIVEHLKCKANAKEMADITRDNIPNFDGNTMLGISQLLQVKESPFCVPCNLGFMTPDANKIGRHFMSVSHYDNILEHLNEKNMKEKISSNRNSAKISESDTYNTKIQRERGDRASEDEESDDERLASSIRVKNVTEIIHIDDEDVLCLEKTIDEVGENLDFKKDEDNAIIYDQEVEEELALRFAEDIDFENI